MPCDTTPVLAETAPADGAGGAPSPARKRRKTPPPPDRVLNGWARDIHQFIQQTSGAAAALKKTFQEYPAPEMRLIIRVIYCVLLEKARGEANDAESLEQVNALLRLALAWEHIEEARRRRELAARKHKEEQAFREKTLAAAQPRPPASDVCVDTLLPQLELPGIDVLPPAVPVAEANPSPA